ncbi:hypothetical protein Micbo1qcDRAFT_128742, partial [Microdochium bolleyi]
MSHWLQFRLGAPGLPGPFLYESKSAYKPLHDIGGQVPKTIIAVGSTVKRGVLTEFFSIADPDVPGTIRLIRSQKTEHIFLDCELHGRTTIERIKGGPVPLNVALHELSPREGLKDLQQMAFRIYYEALSPISSIMLLFWEDLGDLGRLVEILEDWAHISMQRPLPTPPTIVLVSNGG